MKGAIVITASDRPEKEFHDLYDMITKAINGQDGLRVIPCDLDVLQEVDSAGRKLLRHIVREPNGHRVGELEFDGQMSESFKSFLVRSLKTVGKDVWYGAKGPPPKKEENHD